MMSKKVTTSEFIEKAKMIHGNKYDYSQVNYVSAIKNIKIICKKHGEFEQTPNNHLSRKGCIKCGHELSAASSRSNTKEFIKRIIKVRSNRYDYSLVDYINAKTKIKIICPLHGTFLQIPRSHLRSGCPRCGSESSSKIRSSNTKEFIKKAIKIHKNKYDYSKANYIGTHKKIIIICKDHRCFLQRPQSHLQGSGCPKCGIILLTEKQKNKFISEETRRNMRLSAVKRIKEINGYVYPGFNKNACQFIGRLNEEKNWNLRHAMNGGEFYIKELGYWVDGYDKEKNIVFEYDEPRHYDYHRNLKPRDVIRQNNIIKYLDCRFFRYNEKEDELYEVI